MAITAKEARNMAKVARLRIKQARHLAEIEEKKQRRKILQELRKSVSESASNVLEHISEDITKHTQATGETSFVTERLSDFLYMDDQLCGSKPGSAWRMLVEKVSASLKDRRFKVKILTNKRWYAHTRLRISY